MTYIYKVRVVGKGIVFKTADAQRAQQYAASLIPEAEAKVITVPASR